MFFLFCFSFLFFFFFLVLSIRDWLADIGLEKQADMHGKVLEDHQYYSFSELLEAPPSEEHLKEYGIPPGRHLNLIVKGLKDAGQHGKYYITYIHTYIHAYIHTYIHTYIPTYIHAYIHTYILTYLLTYLHTYICTYILTYIHTYMHTYIHTYTRTYTHTHTCTHADTHTYTHTHTYSHIHTYTCILTHIHTYLHTHTYIHTYIHTYKHTLCTYRHTYRHTYTHTHIQTCIHTTNTHIHLHSTHWFLKITHTHTYIHTYMHAHPAPLHGNDFSSYSPPPFPMAKSGSEFYGRGKSLDDAWKYIESAMKLTSHAFNAKDEKFALLGTSGMKGIGKSELLKQLGRKINTNSQSTTVKQFKNPTQKTNEFHQ